MAPVVGRILRIPTLVALCVALGGMQVGCGQAQARPSLQGLTDQIEDLSQRLEEALDTVDALTQRVAELEAQPTPESLLALAPFLQVVPDAVDGLPGPHVMIEGVNLHVRSGSGSTSDGGSPSGLGNLVVGYNEPRELVDADSLRRLIGNQCLASAADAYDFATDPRSIDREGGERICDGLLTSRRSGSHNIVVGAYHNYSSHGGVVAGIHNALDDQAIGSTILGGIANQATHPLSSIVGGVSGLASANASVIVGGRFNRTYDNDGLGGLGGKQANPPDTSNPASSSATRLGHVVLGGRWNQVAGVIENVIVGGNLNDVTNGNDGVILGGADNWIGVNERLEIEKHDDTVITGGIRGKIYAGAEIQPLMAIAEGIAVRLNSPGGCGSGTQEWLDILSIIPVIGDFFSWLGIGCDI